MSKKSNNYCMSLCWKNGMRMTKLISHFPEHREYLQINLPCKSSGSLKYIFSFLSGRVPMIVSLVISFSAYSFILIESTKSKYSFHDTVDKKFNQVAKYT